jgi:hypothetical protein
MLRVQDCMQVDERQQWTDTDCRAPADDQFPLFLICLFIVLKALNAHLVAIGVTANRNAGDINRNHEIFAILRSLGS